MPTPGGMSSGCWHSCYTQNKNFNPQADRASLDETILPCFQIGSCVFARPVKE